MARDNPLIEQQNENLLMNLKEIKLTVINTPS